MNPRRMAVASALLSLALFSLIPSVSTAEAEVVPGEVLVGVRAGDDAPVRWRGTSSTVGTTVEYIRQLHVYRIVLRPGMSIRAAVSILKRRSDVVYAEANHVVYAVSDPNDVYYSSNQYGPQKVQANLAWGIWSPVAQTILAIVDTGIDYTHPDLTNKILRDGGGTVIGFNSTGSNAHSVDQTDPIDDHGHGTHCAGISAAETNNSTGIAGISGWNGLAGSDTANTKLMPVKVLNSAGSGTTVTVANGITWAADHGAKVISMSLGGGGDSTEQNAVAYAWSKGCVIVAAAGNSASSSFFYPAAYPNVISVAATDSSDTLAYFSNFGSWVSTAAPGYNIYSTLPTYAAGGNFGTNYGSLSGTSMACPHVSGEAALIFSQNPGLTNQQVKDFITGNVDPYTPYYAGGTIAPSGGRINVYRALLAAGNGNPQPPAPPTNLIATAGDGSISLTWSASSGATSYTIYRSTTSGQQYGFVGISASTTFTDTGLTNGTTYYYVATAHNAAGDSGYSNEASATPTTTPAAPTNLRVTKATRNEIDLAWNDNSNNETGFSVEISTNGAPFAPFGSTGPNTTTFAAVGLSRRTTYSFRVRALGAGSNSGYSNVVSAKTKG